jgi:hypothetical protein
LFGGAQFAEQLSLHFPDVGAGGGEVGPSYDSADSKQVQIIYFLGWQV